jgi:DeoR/GlpR family transcriptional regulator of sugar metabolism
MIQEQRKQQILDYLVEHTFADIDTLVNLLDTSPATVRRDLHELADRGDIVRTRGGASLAVKGVGHEPPFHFRAKENILAKRLIAKAAKDFVQEGDVIGIDVGSTTLEFARLLRDLRNITIFTASIFVADVLANSDVNVILVGGTLRKREMSVAGPIATQVLGGYYFDKFFLGTAGVTQEEGFTDFSIDDVEVKKAFLAHSGNIIALADHTKLGRVSFAKICPTEAVSRLITDSKADPDQVEALRLAGLEIIIAGQTS